MPEAKGLKRYRLSVPEADGSVIRWLEAQQNLSASLRLLIRQDIRAYGYSDLTCRDVIPLQAAPVPVQRQEYVPEEVPERSVSETPVRAVRNTEKKEPPKAGVPLDIPLERAAPARVSRVSVPHAQEVQEAHEVQEVQQVQEDRDDTGDILAMLNLGNAKQEQAKPGAKADISSFFGGL